MSASSKKTILHLPLKGEYFEAIRSGKKLEEYRAANDYWTKRLVDRHWDYMLLTWGYPKTGDRDRAILLPYFGFTLRINFKHPHFGEKALNVYAIDVSHCTDFSVI